MKNTVTTLIFIFAIFAVGTSNAHAMSGEAHFMDAELLLNTPAERGGAAGLSPEKLRGIQQWIDNPAQKTGKYKNRATGTTVHPNNHGHLRHNPENVAKALSGNGQMDSAIRNVARLHKIQDVSHNTAGVDGYPEITPQMRKEANSVLKYVRKKHRLPKKLPGWVDAQGPLLAKKPLEEGGKAASRGARAAAKQKIVKEQPTPTKTPPQPAKTGKATKVPKSAGKVAKIAGPVAVVAEVAIRGKDVYDTEQAFKNGEISQHDRGEAHARNAGGFVGGVGGAAGGAYVGVCFGSPFGPVGMLVGAGIGGIVGGFAGDGLGSLGGKAIYNAVSEDSPEK